MNLDHLRYFEAVAKLEHYGRAAEKLHISQPALSYAIDHLETELGVPLFHREGRNVRLTRYGQYFLRAITGSLVQLDTGIRAMQEFGENGGIVLVGGIRKLAARTIPGLMQAFLRETHEDSVRFELHTESIFSSELLKDLEKGDLDLAFVSQSGDSRRFECIPFASAPFVLVVPLSHPLAAKKAVPLRDCLLEEFVFFSPRSGLRRPVDALFSQINALPRIACETEEDDVIAGMVEAGFGIAILPDVPVLRSYRLAVLELTDVDAARTAYLCRKRLPEYPAAADHFFRFCSERLTTTSTRSDTA